MFIHNFLTHYGIYRDILMSVRSTDNGKLTFSVLVAKLIIIKTNINEEAN